MEAVENKMEVRKNTLLWVTIGVLFVFALFLTYKASSLTGNAISDGKINTSDWTANEKMNYEMHGTIPARLQGKLSASSQSSGAGMVGGC